MKLTDNWLFYLNKENKNVIENLDSLKWEAITLPHTWNNIDGQDGYHGDDKKQDTTDYFRGEGYYLNRLFVKKTDNNSRYILRFDGANSKCAVYVNGELVGKHIGGYTAFQFDITNYIHLDEDNALLVCVNNEHDETIAPLTADFTFYGGIYRDAFIYAIPCIHFSQDEYCGAALKLLTEEVTKESAKLQVKCTVKNDSDENKNISLKISIKNTDERVVEISLDAGESTEIDELFIVKNPHLWAGREDPFLYEVTAELIEDEAVIQTISDNVGLRFFTVSKDDGFYLNGKKYPLRGVCRHQDRLALGNALTTIEHDEDFKILYEIGATAVRLAHYPQASYFYSLCDKYGIVVWAEIPFVDKVGGSGAYENPDDTRKTFFKNTCLQMTELIRQQINHPSIVVWGIQNEVKAVFDDAMIGFTKELYDLCKSEDSSRLVTQATNQPLAYKWKSDLMAWNYYPGWYGGKASHLGKIADAFRKKDERPLCFSEYGAGANINHHELKPKKVKHNGSWHPEEYQSYCHERFLKAINERDYLWGTFVWNLFEFASDWRNEGDAPGLNDKGLVTFDRKVKKDAFYLYKANWNKEPVTYITSRRFKNRDKKLTEIKVYSNEKDVTLFVNDEKISEKNIESCKMPCTFIFKRVKLKIGENKIKAVSKNGCDEIIISRSK